MSGALLCRRALCLDKIHFVCERRGTGLAVSNIPKVAPPKATKGARIQKLPPTPDIFQSNWYLKCFEGASQVMLVVKKKKKNRVPMQET